MNRTKIICTIGPSVGSFEKILALIDVGMSVARLNFSHGTHEEHLKMIQLLKRAREERQTPLAIMLDTKGPEIRVGKIPGDVISLQAGDRLVLVRDAKKEREIPVHPFEAFHQVSVGTKVLFDDGYICSEIVRKDLHEIEVEIQNNGILKSNKGINVPGAIIDLPAMTKQDMADLRFGCEQDVDYVAASFIRSSHHVLSIKDFLAKEGKGDILVIAKIENAQGVENFDSIVQVADGIMIARGDLGVEVDLALVPKLQKMMIRKCYLACKPVVTATQMLESMIGNPRPTRAEVSDVANAIYDQTTAVMLSGETAMGKYPIETVERMSGIIKEAEADVQYRSFFEEHSKKDYHDISSSVSLAAVKTAYSANAQAIFAFTSSGTTARLLSRLRPEMPIVALTTREKIYHQMAFNWGVIPVFAKDCKNAKEAFSIVGSYALEKKIIEFGDVVVVTAGMPFGKKGSTNMMMVESVGDILVRGHKGHGEKVSAKVSLIFSAESSDPDLLAGRLVVISHCDQTFLPLLKKASGVILQNYMGDIASEKYAELVAKTFQISVMTRADGAMLVLQENEEVTLDPKRGIIYRGSEEAPSCKILSI